MGFFDIPPPEQDEDDFSDLEEYPEGRWMPGILPLARFIGRSEQAAVGVGQLLVLPDGFEINVVAWLRRPPQRRRHRHEPFDREIMLATHGPYGPWDEAGQLPDEFVRFGVQFADGGRATNLDLQVRWPDASDPIHGMSTHSGSSSSGESEQTFWIWPVPDEGDIALVCEWPAYGIGESWLTIDGDELRAAAARAQPVWPGEPPPDGPRGGNRVSSVRRTRLASHALTDASEAGDEAETGETD
jgi:hypothetical protein